MAAAKLTPAVELIHRQKLKTDLATVADTGAVFIRPEFFSSQQDFVKAVCKEVAAGDDLEVQFCQISWLGYEDDPDDPCEDNPTVKIVYKMHFFHQFIQERSDGTNSHDTFTAMIINVRNKFLATIHSVPNTEREAAKQQNFIITDENSEFFQGAYGHWCNLITKIELE
jgi:hypothetical protein